MRKRISKPKPKPKRDQARFERAVAELGRALQQLPADRQAQLEQELEEQNREDA